MPWIEQRRRQYRVYERTEDGKRRYEPFTTRDDAELFVAFVAHSGWEAASATVRSPALRPDRPAPPARAAHLASVRSRTESRPSPTKHPRPAGVPSRMTLPPPAILTPAGLTVGQLVTWHIDGLIGLQHKTIAQYRSYVRDYIDPFFGDLDAGYVIATPHPDAVGTCAIPVTAWRHWLNDRPVLTRKGPHPSRLLAGKTKKNIMSLASAAYKTAMADDFRRLVTRNPVRGGARRLTGHDTTERTYLTVDQAWAVHAALPSSYQTVFLFGVLTGLRWGEIAGLRVQDVCVAPEHGRAFLDVNVALKRQKGGRWALGALKSPAARRRLTIPQALIAGLRTAVDQKGPTDLVFTTTTGKPLHHGNFCRDLARAIEHARAAGAQVPDFTPHSLRHTCAAWLLTAGRTLYQVSRQLGHESEATTGRHYGHLLAASRDVNADALDHIVGQGLATAPASRQSVIHES